MNAGGVDIEGNDTYTYGGRGVRDRRDYINWDRVINDIQNSAFQESDADDAGNGDEWGYAYKVLEEANKLISQWERTIKSLRKKLMEEWSSIYNVYENDLRKIRDKANEPTIHDLESHAKKISANLMGRLYQVVFYSHKNFEGYDKLTSDEKVDVTNINVNHLFVAIQNRIEGFERRSEEIEAKLYPEDIKWLCGYCGIKWSPLTDVEELFKKLEDKMDRNDLRPLWFMNIDKLEKRAPTKEEVKKVLDYYDKIDPICYEYLRRVLPMFSVKSEYYQLPDIEDVGIPGELVKVDDNLYDQGGGTWKSWRPEFMKAIKNIVTPTLAINQQSFGIEGFVNLRARCEGTYHVKFQYLNEINRDRLNTAFYYLYYKSKIRNLANIFYAQKSKINEYDLTIQKMDKEISERDIVRKDDKLGDKMTVLLDALKFWKSSDESKIEVERVLSKYGLDKYFQPLDRLNYATVGKFLSLEDTELFNAVMKDLELNPLEIPKMKRAISDLKEWYTQKKEMQIEKEKEKERKKQEAEGERKQLIDKDKIEDEEVKVKLQQELVEEQKKEKELEEEIAKEEKIIQEKEEEIHQEEEEIKAQEEKLKEIEKELFTTKELLQVSHEKNEQIKQELNRLQQSKVDTFDLAREKMNELQLSYAKKSSVYENKIKTLKNMQKRYRVYLKEKHLNREKLIQSSNELKFLKKQKEIIHLNQINLDMKKYMHREQRKKVHMKHQQEKKENKYKKALLEEKRKRHEINELLKAAEIEKSEYEYEKASIPLRIIEHKTHKKHKIKTPKKQKKQKKQMTPKKPREKKPSQSLFEKIFT